MAYFAPYIDEHGIQMPTYEERLTELIRAYREIFGNEVVLDESTPDYQLLSVFARALDDTSALVVQDYNSRNVDYATGQSLDLLAAGYGISRRMLQNGTESDANLRARVKGAMASRGCADVCALEAALRGLEYVQDVRIYVNDGDAVSTEGFPGHSLACVVYSGRNQQIAETIWDKKAPGVGTYGTTSCNVTDENGVSHAVQFSRPVTTLITIVIRIRHLNGYDASVEDVIKAAVADYVSHTPIGQDFIVSELYGVCYNAVPKNMLSTFMIGDILTSSSQGAYSDIYPVAWNGRVTATAATISFQEIS